MRIAGRRFGGGGTEQWVSDLTRFGTECSTFNAPVIVACRRDIGSATNRTDGHCAGSTTSVGSHGCDW